MEALAVFGIACNVIQVIDFTRETIAICKEIYNSGVYFDRDGYVDKVAHKYEGLCYELQLKLKDEGDDFDPHARELLDIARDCLRASNKLKIAAGKLSHSAKGNALRSLFSGVSAKWKEGRLTKLEADINKHQARMESHLLMKQNAKFYALESTLRIFIANIAQGQKSIEHLIEAQKSAINVHISEEVAAQTNAIKEHITREFETNKPRTYDAIDDAQQAYEKLMKSLRCDGLNDRKSQVVLSHTGTFEWIYDSNKWTSRPGTSNDKFTNGTTENGHEQHIDDHSSHTCGPASSARFSCFPCWLVGVPGSPYWLCGKAGSGKSTLVKFLMSHKNTIRLLEKAHGPTLIVAHFFWLSGSPIQRSLRGVALSLLSQLLSQIEIENEQEEVVMEPTRRRWTQEAVGAILRAVPSASRKVSAQDWSYEELCGATEALLEASPSTVCIFLDGLDEADMDVQSASPKPVLSFVDKLCRLPRVKVCISSRPEPAFHSKYYKDPQLLVQNLTRDDIMAYVVDNFESQLPPSWNEDDHNKSMVQDLAAKVCEYSDGVFLWVRLVMRSLLQGLVNGDTLTQLHERLELLPRDINKLYQNMWDRLDEGDQQIYQREAALYINMALDRLQISSYIPLGDAKAEPPLSDIQLYAANHLGEVQSLFANPSRHSIQTIQSQSAKFGKRIETLTAGLLEVATVASSSLKIGQIGFIHRSAKEFFVNTVEGQRLLAADTTTKAWRLDGILRGILCRKWIDWFEKESSISLKSPLQFKVIYDFMWAVVGAFHNGYVDRQQQLSLIHLCERAFFASNQLTGRRIKAVEWKHPDENFLGPLIETHDFTDFIIRLGDPELLVSCLGADLDDTERLMRVADSNLSQEKWPMVYSQDYKAFILYNLLRNHYLARGGGSFMRNYESIFWMLDQGVFENWPQGKAVAGNVAGLAGMSVLALLGHCKYEFELQFLMVLQRCLLLENAWTENPVFTIEESLPRTGACTILENPLFGNISPFGEDTPSYRLLCQVSMPFAVLAGLESICTDGKEIQQRVRELRDEVWRRYPEGPPPAKIFMLTWHDHDDKRDCPPLDVSEMSWSSLSLAQFNALRKPGKVGPLENDVFAANTETCKSWTSLEGMLEEIKRRMMA
ncbi:uncharacterized protein SPSK_00991 [Sporothrix schenckii 1099-18]|uniref:Nephrocystin 3-like N-terminal domain-containing protein n=1 Tax=Sporothrix schenckii 1099-18 TaxID=1397361 RepID=A0A0F2LVN9_SPOSC|nr:uncharacterized protein SPSK_00991 [Sporothrix schenckii 1099-18]KJR81532.1 hypothetical protein SPSK_00991 [Sporothrix schenckii 1099-18]